MGGAIGRLRDVLAIARDLFSWRDPDQLTDVVKAGHAVGYFKTLLLHREVILKRMRIFVVLISKNSVYHHTESVFDILSICHLLQKKLFSMSAKKETA